MDFCPLYKLYVVIIVNVQFCRTEAHNTEWNRSYGVRRTMRQNPKLREQNVRLPCDPYRSAVKN